MKKVLPYYLVILIFILILFITGWSAHDLTLGSNHPETGGSNDQMKPEPAGWYTGDIHVHRSCDGSPALPSSRFIAMMEENDLAVISVLGDIGNSEVADRIEDMRKVNGKDDPQSIPGRIIHYSAEWHWDADSKESPHQALGGHIVILGPEKAQKIWDERLYKVLEWGREAGGVCGFAHMQYLTGKIPQKLNCCIPMGFPVEVALGTVDFLSEDCNGGDSAMEAYYKLLNCGFRPGLAAGTDYPCNGGEPFGTLLTYVYVPDGNLSYGKWIEGIKKGKTVVSRNAHREFLELKLNDHYIPGDELNLGRGEKVKMELKWSTTEALQGTVELVCNGRVIASESARAGSGQPFLFSSEHWFDQSSWICARRMGEKGHMVHTAPVYITIANQPVRANASDAIFFVEWIDNILDKIAPGREWSGYYDHHRDEMIRRYTEAKQIYAGISEEAEKNEK